MFRLYLRRMMGGDAEADAIYSSRITERGLPISATYCEMLPTYLPPTFDRL